MGSKGQWHGSREAYGSPRAQGLLEAHRSSEVHESHGPHGSHEPHGSHVSHGPQGSHGSHGSRGPQGAKRPMGIFFLWAPWHPWHPWAQFSTWDLSALGPWACGNKISKGHRRKNLVGTHGIHGKLAPWGPKLSNPKKKEKIRRRRIQRKIRR